MICERCGQRFDRNPRRWKGGRVRSNRKVCNECRMIIRKESSMKPKVKEEKNEKETK